MIQSMSSCKSARCATGIGMGDYQIGGSNLSILLDDLAKRGCDVTICCCRNIAAIETHVSFYSDHLFVNKTISTGRANDRIVNGLDAQRMFDYV